MLKTLRIAVAAAAIGLSAGSAGAVTVGFDAIERGSYDSYTNFALALTDLVIASDGIIDSYEVFARQGTLGLLVLRPTAIDNQFTLIDADLETAVNGKQTFGANLSVQANDIIGLFLGSGKVSYQLDSTPNVCSAFTCDTFFTVNGGANNVAGLIGSNLAFSGSTDRTYSVNANLVDSQVPLPAAFPMLLAALAGLGFLGWRRRGAEPAQPA